jgi:curved DNA-binding protein CbpA
MADERQRDYYEILQISPSADADMIHRVYRLLAQRYHPDNGQTGNLARFQEVQEAYAVLSDPPQRARYDADYHMLRRARMRLVATADQVDNDFEAEHALRLRILEALYTQRRIDAQNPGVFDLDLEQLAGAPRERLEFAFWYLISRNLVKRGDSSRLTITADGVDFLEHSLQATHVRRLPAATHHEPPAA